MEVSIKVLDGGTMCATGLLAESGDLVSFIEDSALRALLEEVEISDNGAVVELMIKGRC